MFRRFMSRKGELFLRPNSTLFTRVVNWPLPPAPQGQVALQFDDLTDYYRPWYYLLGIAMLIGFQGLRITQERLWSILAYSPLSFSLAARKWLRRAIAHQVTNRSKRRQTSQRSSLPLPKVATASLINRMAIIEEQWFREGAENWTLRQRFMSCISFGFVHQGNLVYRLSTILPLSGLGAIFMAEYLHTFRRTRNRRDAVLAAAALHRSYNHCAIALIVASDVYAILGHLSGRKARNSRVRSVK